jgi:hypothetical protein
MDAHAQTPACEPATLEKSAKESLIAPGVEISTLVWTFLLGLPGLLIFLVLQKQAGL